MNPSLLAGNTKSGGQPYATSALNAELMNQLLRTYQGFLKNHMEKRMKLVAEAQEHFDYEKRGDTRVPIMEEVIEYDEEGNPMIVEKNKLLIPELRMKVFDLRDEQTQRQFYQQLKAEGVPISDKTMAMGAQFVFDEELEMMQEEIIKKTVTQQEAKVQAYRILQARGLPIPPDLKAEIEGGAAGPEPGVPTPGAMGITAPPGGGMIGTTPQAGEPIVMPNEPGGGPSVPGGPPGAGAIPPGPPGAAPEISQERMRGPGLPTPPGTPGGVGRPVGASVEAKNYSCKYCSEQATKGHIWAEGAAIIPTCDKHGERALSALQENGYGDPDEVRDLTKVSEKLPRRKSSGTLPSLVTREYEEEDTDSTEQSEDSEQDSA
jgi:hypothetical protein